MIPQRTFLMKTVPYFLLRQFKKEDGGWRLRKEEEIDKKFRMGIVQTPQSFYIPDLFQFNLYAEGNIPNEQNFRIHYGVTGNARVYRGVRDDGKVGLVRLTVDL